MKRILIAGLIGLAIAAPNNNTNLVKQKAEIQAIPMTTFKNFEPLFDGVISSKENFSILASGKANQNIIIQLKHPYYVRQIKVFVDKTNRCDSVLARFSKDNVVWQEISDIDVEQTNDSVVFNIKPENVLAGYIALVFKPKAGIDMRIQEIEVYPQMDIRLRSRHIKDNWQVTDKEVFNNIDTKLDAFVDWTYSRIGAPTAERFKSRPAPVLTGENLSAGGLTSGTPYEYKMSITDYNGNVLDLEPRYFTTKPESYASKKKTEGTFNTYYSGNAIPATKYPATDGSTDINTGLAMSGSVKTADQFLIVDLGELKDVSQVATIWRNLGFSKDFSILVSQDKVNWKNVAEHQNAGIVTPARTAEGHPIRVVFSDFGKTKARYIKLQINKGSDYYSKHGTAVMELFELKAF